MANLDEKLTLRLLDKVTEPARRIAQASDQLTKRLVDSQKALNEFGSQRKAIHTLREMQTGLAGVNAKQEELRKRLPYLRSMMESFGGSGTKIGKQWAKEIDQANKELAKLSARERAYNEKIADRSAKLREHGVNVSQLAHEYNRLGNGIAHTTKQMETLAKAQGQVDAATERHEKMLQRSAHLTIAAAGMQRVGQGIMSALTAPAQQMRGVEAAKGDLQAVGVVDTAAILNKGREMAAAWAGIDTASFARAAYDIKGGIESLSDRGVADMTASAALTATATKSSVEQMTNLFAAAHGTFKETLYKGLSDSQFGDLFAAQLTGAAGLFRADGSSLETAIQSMGSGLAASGVALQDQLAGLGMLMQRMDGGSAGTVMKALERSAATAQRRFAAMGFGVQTLDASGNMQSLPVLLEQMQATFGDKYTTQIGDMIKQAFGSDEAVGFFKALWGQQEAFRENARALEEMGRQGKAYTEGIARLKDANMDARLTKLGQRWDLIMEKLGYRLIPVLERVIPAIESVIGGIGRFVEANPGLTTGLLAIGVAVGGFALLAAPAIIALAAFGNMMTWVGVQAAKGRAAAAMGALGGGGGGSLGKGRWGGLGGKLGVAGALTVGGIAIGSTLMDKELSGTEKAAGITKEVGTIGGGLLGAAKGAAAGAALGSVVPLIGTAAGGVIGGLLGGLGGSMAGNWLGEQAGGGIQTVAGWFGGDKGKAAVLTAALATGAPAAAAPLDPAMPAAQVASAAEASRQIGVAPPAPVHVADNRQISITVAQRAGEDAEAIARRVAELIQRDEDTRRRGALYDID